MKRLLTILAVLLLASSAHADESIQLARMNPAVLGSAGCTASYGSPISPQNNCSDIGGSESSATTGWTSTTCDPFDGAGTAKTGDYALRATADGGADDLFYRAFSGLDASTMYKLSFSLRHNGSATGTGRWICWLSRSNTNQQIFVDIDKDNKTYVDYTQYFYFNDYMDNFGCKESNAENDGGVYLDDYKLTTASPCLSDELYTFADAASIDSETNGVSGWNLTTAGSGVLESVTTDPQHGSHHIRFLANGANDRFQRDISSILETGHKYFVSAKLKSVAGGAFLCYLATSHTTNQDISWYIAAGTDWRHMGSSVVHDGSAIYLGCVEYSAANNSEIYIDSISIKEILSE